MDVKDGNFEKGTVIQLWEIIGGENQRWILELTQKEIDGKKKESWH